MKKIAATLIAATSLALVAASPALAASATGKGANPNGKPFVAIAGQIVEVEGKVSTLQDQVESLVRRVDTIEDRVVANEEAIDSLSAQNEALRAQLAANAGDIDAIKAKIAALEAQNAALQSQINANRGDILALEAQLATNNGLIAALQQSISSMGASLQSQIDNNERLIDYLIAEIDQIKAVLARKQDILRGQCPSGMALRSIYPDGTIWCEPTDAGSSGIYANYLINYSMVYPYNSFQYNLTCPSNTTLTGGGFDAYNMNIQIAAPYYNTFYSRVYNPNNYYGYLYTFAVCVGTYR